MISVWARAACLCFALLTAAPLPAEADVCAWFLAKLPKSWAPTLIQAARIAQIEADLVAVIKADRTSTRQFNRVTRRLDSVLNRLNMLPKAEVEASGMIGRLIGEMNRYGRYEILTPIVLDMKIEIPAHFLSDAYFATVENKSGVRYLTTVRDALARPELQAILRKEAEYFTGVTADNIREYRALIAEGRFVEFEYILSRRGRLGEFNTVPYEMRDSDAYSAFVAGDADALKWMIGHGFNFRTPSSFYRNGEWIKEIQKIDDFSSMNPKMKQTVSEIFGDDVASIRNAASASEMPFRVVRMDAERLHLALDTLRRAEDPDLLKLAANPSFVSEHSDADLLLWALKDPATPSKVIRALLGNDVTVGNLKRSEALAKAMAPSSLRKELLEYLKVERETRMLAELKAAAKRNGRRGGSVSTSSGGGQDGLLEPFVSDRTLAIGLLLL